MAEDSFLTNILVAVVSLGKEHRCRALEGGKGLVIILRAWSGCVGGCCAVQANDRSMCECAAVLLAVCVSLLRLSGAAVDLCEVKKIREIKNRGGGGDEVVRI